MNQAFLSFLRNLRCKQNINALISVDASMGMPMLENNIVYLPFFKRITADSCALHAELFVEYPSGTVISYRKAMNAQTFHYDKQCLTSLKKEYLDPQSDISADKLIKEMSVVSEEMALIYKNVKESCER